MSSNDAGCLLLVILLVAWWGACSASYAGDRIDTVQRLLIERCK